MDAPIRILHLEDNPTDSELIQSLLEADGIAGELVRVETREHFLAGLERGGWHLILSDNSLPSFDGLAALALAREKCPDVPFIFFSGTLGEDVAIEALKLGATDYILKQRMARFIPAIRRALRETEMRVERKALEVQLYQAQKMEAVGQLAGGIAHDFNNLLTVINGYCQILLTAADPGDPKREELEQIKMAGERATNLTRQLLAFSRRQILQLRVVDLNAIVTNLDNMLQRMIGEDIELKTVFNPSLGRVKADQGQIEQVLMNLAVNARDAMPQGGKLTIETTNVELGESYTQRHITMTPGRYVLLAVSDTGCGMDEDIQKHMFEPFFTTKEKGKGTGLGLSTVYGIVKQSGGYVWVYSEPGQGTTFKIYLPRVEERVETVEPVRLPVEMLRGTETILLVEDDAGVRALARGVLKSGGYTLLEASNGAEALRVAGQHNDTIHLLVSDVVMPGMSGRQLEECLSAIHPNVKTLYMSGYADNAIVHHGILEPGLAFLQKPFTPDALLRKVREALGSEQEERP